MTKLIAVPKTPGADKIRDLFGPLVLAAFKRGARWWLVIDCDEPYEISAEDWLDRVARDAD